MNCGSSVCETKSCIGMGRIRSQNQIRVIVSTVSCALMQLSLCLCQPILTILFLIGTVAVLIFRVYVLYSDFPFVNTSLAKQEKCYFYVLMFACFQYVFHFGFPSSLSRQTSRKAKLC